MKTLVIGVVIVASMSASSGGTESWAERLGYPPDKRVLLLHADDVGLCYEANQATRELVEHNHLGSCSAMAPCPWFDAFCGWCEEMPDLDVGLHVTLTSEWKHYRWRPLSPPDKTPGLRDESGFMWREVKDLATTATAEEVALEIEAQIQYALSRGLRPTHLDTHMGAVYARPDYTKVYLDAAVRHNIPAMAIEPTEEVIEHFKKDGFPVSDLMIQLLKDYPLPKLDRFLSVPKGDSYAEVKKKFLALLDMLPPGLTEIVLHPCTESDALREIMNAWRQRNWEARLLADEDVRAHLAQDHFLFTDWGEMMNRHEQRVEAR